MYNPLASRPALVDYDAAAFEFGEGAPEADYAGLAAETAAFLGGAAPSMSDASESVWTAISRDSRGFVRQGGLASADGLRALCARIFASPLTHGFLQGHVAHGGLSTLESSRRHVGHLIADRVFRLAEAIGARDVLSPEHVAAAAYTLSVADIQQTVDAIEDRLGASIAPPPMNGGLFGLRLRQGLFSERHFDAIYVAQRLLALLDGRPAARRRVLEIGGGAGLVAYYARRFGIGAYTIIDLPLVSVVQFLNLRTAFGADAAYFDDGTANTDLRPGIRLISADHAERFAFDRFDLVVNVDSLPEMSEAAARAYVSMAHAAGLLLSINQESRMENGATRQTVVRSLAADRSRWSCRSRHPYWMRIGYLEEVFEARG